MERAEDCYESVLAELRAKKKRLAETDTSQLTQDELREYEDSVKAYRDIKNSLDTALMQGREEGRVEGHAEGLKQGREEGRVEGRVEGREEGHADVAKAMLKRGMDIKTIAELSGLTEEEIKKL